MVWQFAYIYGVVEILLLSGKKYKVWLQFFTLSQGDNNHHKTKLHKTQYRADIRMIID